MSEEASDFIKATAEGIIKGSGAKMPSVYPDLLQPAAKQIGRTLELVTGAVNVALISVGASIFGYDQMKYFEKEIADRLTDVPLENIKAPKATVVGPSIEAVRFLGEEPYLRKLFSQLIATSMNKEKEELAHPGFVEIIKNLSVDDAKVFRLIADSEGITIVEIFNTHPKGNFVSKEFLSRLNNRLNLSSNDGGRGNLDNLLRLGLIEKIEAKTYISKEEILPKIINNEIKQLWELKDSLPFKNVLIENNPMIRLRYAAVNLTSFGIKFATACL